MEVWKRIEGVKRQYEVSNLGRVRRYVESTKRFKYLKLQKTTKGYLRVMVGMKNKQFVHRLVATAFISKIDGKQFVNHKDGIKENNFVENLEWVTAIENNIHACTVLGITKIHPVHVVNEKGEIVNSFDSKKQLNESGYSLKGLIVFEQENFSKQVFDDYIDKKLKRPKTIFHQLLCRKLTDEQVLEIRAMSKIGVRDCDISRHIGCNSYSISCIIKGKTYRNVK